MKRYLILLLLLPGFASAQKYRVSFFTAAKFYEYVPTAGGLSAYLELTNLTDSAIVFTGPSGDCRYRIYIDDVVYLPLNLGCYLDISPDTLHPHQTMTWGGWIPVDLPVGRHILEGDLRLSTGGQFVDTIWVMDPNDRVVVTTDKQTYHVGDSIGVKIGYWNPDNTPLHLEFPDACQFDYCIDSSHCWLDGKACATVITSAYIPPDSFYFWQSVFTETIFPGEHTLTAYLGGRPGGFYYHGSATTTFGVDKNSWSIATDKDFYLPIIDSVITITLSYSNNEDSADTLDLISGRCRSTIFVDSSDSPGKFCDMTTPAFYGGVIVPPHTSTSWSMLVENTFSVGTHSIAASITSWRDKLGSAKTSFTVLGDTLSFRQFAGWNMVSYPYRETGKTRTDLFPNSLSRAFTYDNRYKVSDTLRHGVGYWVKLSESKIVPMCGERLLVDSVDLKKGWNLIGSLSVPILKSSLTTIPAGIVNVNLIRGLDPEMRYVADPYLRPGRAYWVKASAGGRLILDGR